MNQDRIAHECRTTVLTESFAMIHDDGRLGSWVRIATGDPSARYDLLSVADFGLLDENGLDVVAEDIRTAVALHNGERLLIYGRRDHERIEEGLMARLAGLQGSLKIESFETKGFVPDEPERAHVVVLTCMDWRLHGSPGALREALAEEMGDGCVLDADILTVAGGAMDLSRPSGRNAHVLRQLEPYLERDARIYLPCHTDCGKYGAEGTVERLRADLKLAGKAVGIRSTRGDDYDVFPCVAVVKDDMVKSSFLAGRW